MEQPQEQLTVVLTGFGPFDSFPQTNPSEQVVRHITEKGHSYFLNGDKAAVLMILTLVVHLGGHEEWRCVKIETRSCGIGYYDKDTKCTPLRLYSSLTPYSLLSPSPPVDLLNHTSDQINCVTSRKINFLFSHQTQKHNLYVT
ncbi:unnamed protein product [Gongylonema pulchrum]|uniref:NAD_binding_6 domain-containing protein n=1 Tax=Gongylonema pulchrum TaxID=637853 RepID=A0A183EGU4_9BILA|nr:unnamed protein product [Gongylonema pulchrum]